MALLRDNKANLLNFIKCFLAIISPDFIKSNKDLDVTDQLLQNT